MKRLSAFWRKWSCRMALALAFTAAPYADAAWHEQHSGSGVLVHYVRLTGHAGNNTAERKILMDGQAACVGRAEWMGGSARLISPDELPKIAKPIDDELYYSENRVLWIKQGKTYDFDYKTCELVTVPHHILELRSSVGKCETDLIKKEARGQCDERAHAQAPAARFAAGYHANEPNLGLDKVPPQFRTQSVATVEQLKPSIAALALRATGATRTIAGHRCQVYRAKAFDEERCVAKPASPFAIPAAGLNGGIAGLVLEVRGHIINVAAQEVILNLSASQDIFSVPKGTKIRSTAWKPSVGTNP